MNGRDRGKQLRDEIYRAYEAAQEARRPNSVRPSEVGKQCARAAWYSLRWADKLEMASGRMLRLWETGHSQEDRMITDIRRVGAEVVCRDPSDASKQIPMLALGGLMRGFLDGMASSVPHASSEWVVVECKTHSAKSFRALEADGVAVAKPEHAVQMTIYMGQHQVPEALYIAINKDTDDIFCEFLPFDQTFYDRIMAKAEMIAMSPRPPVRINAKPEFFLCKFCKASDVCHGGARPERNCRTCREIQPRQEKDGRPADWYCTLHERSLSLDQQRQGCPDHRYNPGLVSGNEIGDKDLPDGFAVVYQMDDGTEWLDRGPIEPMKAPEFSK